VPNSKPAHVIVRNSNNTQQTIKASCINMHEMFKKKHVVSMRDLTRDDVEFILHYAERMMPYAKAGVRMLENRILALLFFEPSTRTQLSFDSAMKRLGGSTLSLTSEESSVLKGETLADTIKVVEGYADAIVLRHPKEGAARMASEISRIPIINGGDGAGHHPTQTLLDLYTIKKESHLDNLDIALLGDLKYGRTAHSLAYALNMFDANIALVAPEGLQMPKQIVDTLNSVRLVEEVDEIIRDVDVLYVTRIQKERFPDPTEYLRVAKSYRLTLRVLERVRENLIIMHPLPRVDEIAPEVDQTKHARYFKQAFYGIPVRMALLAILLNGSI
jgi:aspartate carbamoyltransferase catalytic subunit